MTMDIIKIGSDCTAEDTLLNAATTIHEMTAASLDTCLALIKTIIQRNRAYRLRYKKEFGVTIALSHGLALLGLLNDLQLRRVSCEYDDDSCINWLLIDGERAIEFLTAEE